MLFTVFQLFAQNNEKIHVSGKIVNTANNKALQYATISLTKVNSEDIEGTISDKNGKFDIQTQAGTYTLKIEFLSFEDKIYANFKLTKDIDLGTILLTENPESLETVDVSGESKLTTLKLGKVVYNVEKDISSQTSTATEILENIPSVSVINGRPTIRGTKATVLINGKISVLSKAKSISKLQASSIKKIEVITSPNSRYNANSSGGIINIILKKGLDNGLNASITSTTGIKGIAGAAASLNYRKDKINLYTNTSYFHREPISNTIIENEYTENGIITNYLHESRKNTRKNNVLNTTFGMDYYISDYSSLNVEGNYSKYNGDFHNSTLTNYYEANKILTNTIEQLVNTDYIDDIYEISMSFDQYFERENEAFHVNLSYSNDNEIKNRQLFFNDIFPVQMSNPNDDELIFDDLELTNTAWLTYYTLPVGEKSTLEFGTDGALGKVKHDFLNVGNFITNPSNLLLYTENWLGLYVQFIRNSDKFSYGLGLRTEFTDLTINLQNTNEYSTQKYTDIFPTVQLEYNLNENKMLAFAYRRGIFRVGYEDLNPFELRVSETTSYQGNIDLLPTYPNTFELSLISTKDSRFSIKPTLYFKNYDNTIQNITVETGEIVNGIPKLLTTPINLGYLNFTGIELLSTFEPSEKIEFSSTFDFNYIKQNGIYEYTDSNNKVVVLDYNNTGYNGSIDLNTSIELPHNINFQSLTKYNFISEGAYSKRYGYAYMNVSLNKELFNKKATITLSANDIFDSNKTKRLRWTDDVNSLSNSQWREPTILLTFTYRFNQSKKDRSIDINKKDKEDNY